MAEATDNSWRRLVDVLRATAWRLSTPPPRRHCFAADLRAAAAVALTSDARPVRELAGGLTDFAERAGRRRSRRWTREGARDQALQLARLIEEHEHDMAKPKTIKTRSAKAAATRAAKAPAKTAKASATKGKPAKAARPKPAKSPTPVPSRPHSAPRLWAIAAYVAAAELARLEVTAWDAVEAAAGRLLALRVEGTTAQPVDETFRMHPRPAGFTTWAALARRLADVAVWSPHRARGLLQGSHRVSPYALVIADDEGHALFDPRGRLPSTPEMIASVDQVGVLDAIKVQTLVERGRPVEYVSDGRQRLNTVHRVNERRLRSWHQGACAVGRVDVPPELILEVPIEVLSGTVAEAQRVGGVLNARALRRDDALRDLAHRAPQLRRSGYTREEIAVQLGVSPSTVTNLLALQQLAPSLQRLLWEGRLSPACAYILATQEAAHQDELWLVMVGLPPARRAAHLRALVVAEGRVKELQAVVDDDEPVDDATGQRNLAALKAARAELERLRGGQVEAPRPTRRAKDLAEAARSLVGLDGEGPRLVRAALEFARGGDLDELLEALRSSSTTVVGPLGIVCPDCCMGVGERCVSPADGEDDTILADVRDLEEPHAARVAEAAALRRSAPTGAPQRRARGAKSLVGARGAFPQTWAGHSSDAWEAADVFDQRLAEEAAAAGLAPEDLAWKPGQDPGLEVDLGHTLGSLFSSGTLSLAQVLAAHKGRQQLSLPATEGA